MIYVDTLSGEILIDTERNPAKATVFIIRTASGLHIGQIPEKKKMIDKSSRWLFGAYRRRAFWELSFKDS